MARSVAGRNGGETDGIVLRLGEPGDITTLRAIECDVFDLEQLTARSFARYGRISGADLLVALYRGEIVGYAIASYRIRSERARLISLGVATRCTGRGIGGALLAGIEARARDRAMSTMWLEVRRDNAAAISLYTRGGYRQTAEKPGYYADLCDALVFTRTLS